MRDYDVIVIGSGAGGMTAAVALARAGRRVGVFEQHTLLGGYSQSFELRGFRYSPGVHYIGELGPGGHLRELFEGLGVANDLSFFELNPDGFEHIVVGDERFDMPKGIDALRERLCRRFPREAEGIRGYLDVALRMGEELRWARPQGLRDRLKLPLRVPTILRHGLLSLDHLLDRFTHDPLLRAILSMQSGDHGMAPARVPAVVHAILQNHYFEGAWYPRGGGGSISAAFARELRSRGGETHVHAEVVRVLVEGRRAVGVQLADGQELRADAVVSNVDANLLWQRLIERRHVSASMRRRIARLKPSLATLSLFLATDLDLRAAGLDSGNIWFSRTSDINSLYGASRRADPNARVDGMFISASTLKDPTLRRDGLHTIEAMTIASWESFARWQDSKTGRRPSSYKARKLLAREQMLEVLERFVPDLREHVVYSSVATPLTNYYYVRTAQGGIYGPENSLLQSGPFRCPIETEIPGLYQCGASTLAPGIGGVTRSGLAAAAALLGCQPEELLDPTGQHLTIHSAEDPRTWPDELRAGIPTPVHAQH